MLPRASRLTRQRDFQATYQRRQSYATPRLILYVRRRPGRGAAAEGPARIGFVISKKVAKRAHDRNRWKRRLREICRVWLIPRLPVHQAGDLVFVARAPAPGADFAQLAADVDELIHRSGLLPPAEPGAG